jgi:hypothetical protein
MKKMFNFSKLFATASLSLVAASPILAQSNLGASCGCPAVASRPTVNVSSLPGYVAISGTFGGELTQGATFTCDKTYILDKKIYISSGQTLNIAPGTVIKGAANTIPSEATALTIMRGGKINAMGTESCPIVFTAAADPMNGSYAISNVGKWGGVVVLGKASNNLTLAANGPFVPGGAGKLAVADGLGTVEGFASSNPQDQYGVATSIPVSYVSATSPSSTTYTFDQATSAGASGASTITLTGNGAYVLNGMSVSGTGIAVGATVASVSGNVVTLSAVNTSAVTGNASFIGTFPVAASTTAYFYAGATGTGVTTSFTAGTGPVVGGTNFAIPFIGTAGGSFDDNDNSGIMKYVSIRHSGAILAVGAEINGLTLASVGRGTTIDHIEIVSCADDNIEIFGGTVNLKYITTLFGNDDMFDYDLGWKGKCQFFFGMKNTATGASPDNDNGIEADSDDNASNVAFRSHPVLYNFTIIGNGKNATTADNRGLAGANFKDGAEGELYNSIFANFKNGINLAKSLSGTPARTYNAWHNWRNLSTTESPNTNATTANAVNGGVAVANSLKIKCNTILMNTATTQANGLGIDAASSGAVATAASTTGTDGEMVQFLADGNIVTTTAIPGFSYAFTVDATTNVVTVKNDVTPTTALSVAGCPTVPVDGFFEPANYRGAFSSVAGENWLSDWTYSQVMGATEGVAACPTDLNLDGITDVNDFLIFAPAFGTSCN